jgi:hypothetical protein
MISSMISWGSGAERTMVWGGNVGKEKATMMLALPCDLPRVPHVPCRKLIVDMSGSWRISEATAKPNDQVRLVVTR